MQILIWLYKILRIFLLQTLKALQYVKRSVLYYRNLLIRVLWDVRFVLMGENFSQNLSGDLLIPTIRHLSLKMNKLVTSLALAKIP